MLKNGRWEKLCTTMKDNRYYAAFIVIILVVITVILFSCSKKYCYNHYPCTQRDSISYKELVKIDTFYIPLYADTTFLQTPIDCPDQTIIYKEGKKETQIIIKDKIIKLFSTTKADSLRYILAYKDSKEFKTITQVKQVVVIEYKTPKWAWYLLGLVIVQILALIAYIWFKTHKLSI